MSSFSPPAWSWVGYWSLLLEFASVPLPAAPAVFPQRVLPQVTLRGLRTLFWSQLPAPAPEVELCLLGLRCLWCGAWFSTLCRALPPGPAVLRSLPSRRLPFGVSAFSDTVCLTYCCAGGVGWAATLPLCSQCFSCASWLAGVRWVLHPVSGSSHGGCDCSLGGSKGCLMAPRASGALLLVLSSPPAVLDLCGFCALSTAWFPLP